MHDPEKIGTFKRPCFDYEIGLCPGTCVGRISRRDYMKNISHLKLFLEGKKARVVKSLEKEMASASRKLEFEKAAKLRRQIFALKHIEDTAFIESSEITMPKTNAPVHPFRIEGYDISNISGTSAVGSMVVFLNGKPDKNEYRKFKIRTIIGSNDVGMLVEVLERRFKHAGWRLPDLVLRIPLVGLAKGSERKRNDIIGTMPKNVSLQTLIQVRDEAHRFAISYHKALRRVKTFE
jgi:excinuclease ABC subunit C